MIVEFLVCKVAQHLDSKRLENIVKQKIESVQPYLDSMVLQDSNYFCPLKDSHLQKSSITNTKIGKKRIIKVPQARFYTAIDQLNGKGSGEEKGGYKKNASAKDVNFMIIHKSALIQFSKHVVVSIFRPEENQLADGWAFNYRSYGIADVYENKKNGIYLHTAA
ncbi:hypothetical protein [Treponema sp. OMZ 838]|uniref:hypothetical protein n=1 Tax=Treponema sp. OMZ 838 TaxID=1539298 RepID=UPI000AC36AC1|nr:hypothetical protein [Treponema sp. OMZ 838]